ncbi:transposase [Streptomyces pseudogriseolus]|uniref:transposase n=1 Tax=Streptomyces pseudogriseolus TaxID=36817 RepID=UPI003FA29897
MMNVPTQRRYPREVVERGVRLVLEMRDQSPKRSGSVQEVGELLGVHPQTLRRWLREAQAERMRCASTEITETELIRQLKKENAELRRKNNVLKTAVAMFASELSAGDVSNHLT